MTPERLEQVDRIFQSALELTPEQRGAFLDHTCANDAELRAEVESLLAAHDRAGNSIEDSASPVATSLRKQKPQLPKQITNFKIEKLLGAGGMGEVYLARDRMGRSVALKLLASRLTSDLQHVARFLQESRTVLALNHPNIVTVYEVGESDGSYFIASELIEGETLRHRLVHSELDLQTALEVAIQVATALAAAHEKGIVHRDIKPENVMIRNDGYVKVLDFGVAKLTEEFAEPLSTDAPTRRKLETAEGVVVGTASYMSPEQARGLKVDGRTDVWSCGVMLYEMLAHRSPFTGNTAAEIVGQILNREPAPLARYVNDPPAELQRIINKSLMKNRDERYQTIKDMLLDLKAFKQELEFAQKLERSIPPADDKRASNSSPHTGASASANSVVATTVAPTPVPTFEHAITQIKQHKRGVLIVVALLFVVALGVAYFAFIRSSPSQPIDSIAVMPFENVTHDQNIEYLSDGVTESLINSLSKLPNVKVIARNSVFTYKDQKIDVQKVAQQLGVRAVLTGRVLMKGDTLDVRVELTDAKQNTELWGDHYTRKAGDIFSVQDEIARQVTDTLRVRLTSPQQEQVVKRYTENAEAYRLYLQGRYYLTNFTEENLKRANQYFDQAIALDPRYALAHAARAETLFNMGDLSLPMSDAMRSAKQEAMIALGLDDKLVEARMTLAVIEFQYDWDFARAEKDFQQIIASNPNYAEAHHQYAWYLALLGKENESLTEMKLAQQLDPVNPGINVDLCMPYTLSRQFDQCISESRRALEMFPNFRIAHMVLGDALLFKGDHAAGIEELEKAKAIESTPHMLGELGYAYATAGRKDEARKLLAELKDLSGQRYVSPYFMAMICAGLKDNDQAFVWLEKAYQERSFFLLFIKTDVKMDGLHGDPRFADLISRVGLAAKT